MEVYADVFSNAKLSGPANYAAWTRRYEFFDALRQDDDAANDAQVFLFLINKTMTSSVRKQFQALQTDALDDPDTLPTLIKTPLKWLLDTAKALYGDAVSNPVDDFRSLLRRDLRIDDTALSYIAAKTTAYKNFIRQTFESVEGDDKFLLSVLKDGLPHFIQLRVESDNTEDFKKELPRLLKIYPPERNSLSRNVRKQDGDISRRETRSCNYCGIPGHIERNCRKKMRATGTLDSLTTSRHSSDSISPVSYPPPKSPLQQRPPVPETPYRPRPSAPPAAPKKPKKLLLLGTDRSHPSFPFSIFVGGGDKVQHTIDTVIDTGAPTSCMSADLCAALGATLTKTLQPPLLSANGSHVHVLGHTTLRIAYHTEHFDCDAVIKFLVLQDLATPLLIGWADLKNWRLGELLSPPDAEPRYEDGLELMDINPDLNDDERAKVYDAMDVPGIFSPPPSGASVSTMHSIPLLDDVPVAKHPYKLSHKKREIVRAQVADLLKKDIIEPCHSPYASPVLVIPKKDGSHRMVLDYRELNKISVKRRWPLPRMSDILDRLTDANWISRLDLKHAFYQIPLNPQDRHKTAFVTPNGQYQFKRMPFGLHGAPSTFQRTMDELLADMRAYAIPYLDDIIIFSSDFDSHCRHLFDVSIRLSTTGFFLKAEKCILAYQKTELFGFVVGQGQLVPDPLRTLAIAEMKPPSSRKEVLSFLGSLGYYRKFIKDFARKSLPLVALTSKTVDFHWEQEHQVAFEDLRDNLVSSPILQLPRQDRPFLLRSDASDYATGAVLLQEVDELWMPVAFYSYKLNKAERNYSTTQKEGLAVVKAIEHWDTLLDGVHFEIETDHSALVSIYNLKEPNKRLARWVLTLQAYDFDIRHRPGSEMHLPDALSRLLLLSPQEMTDLRAQQRSDPTTAAMIRAAETRIIDTELTPKLQQLIRANLEHLQVDDDGLLIHLRLPLGSKGRSQHKRAVIPPSLRSYVTDACHSDTTAGHLGFDRTYEKLAQRFWWPDMWKETKANVAKCACQINKKMNALSYQQHSIVVGHPWQVVSADHLGPLPAADSGHRYILVFVDYFTRWTIAVPVPDTTADTTAREFLERVVFQHGVPNTLITDNGTAFANSLLTEITRLLGVKKLKITPAHPQTNGRVERWNHTVISMLRSYTDDYKTNWPELLPAVTFAYNTSKHSSTGQSPFFLNHGFEACQPVDIELGLPLPENNDTNSYAHSLLRSLHLARSAAREQQERLARAQERRLNTKKPHHFDVDQYVYVRDTNPADKLAPRFIGPFRIIATSGLASYVLDTPSGDRLVHTDRLKPHHGPPPSSNVAAAPSFDEDAAATNTDATVSDETVESEEISPLHIRVQNNPLLLDRISFVPADEPQDPADLIGRFVSFYWNAPNNTRGWYNALVLSQYYKRHLLLFADGSEVLARLIGYPEKNRDRWKPLLPITSAAAVEDDSNPVVGGVTEATA